MQKGVGIIEEYAFSDCTKLSGVTLPDGLNKIEGNSFSDCPALKKIVIPSSVKELGDYVFGYEADRELTIVGKSNSAAEIYANKNGIRFKSR